ncbi:MAG: aldehyde ferredoxin oxidoreductase N-terminal domain-containing protein [Thermodesulfobacteriota bacterium]
MRDKKFKLLEVDLSNEKIQTVDVTSEVRRFVGGRSLGAKLLWDRVPPKADPLSAENVLYFGIGPMTGLLGSVTNVSAKSPLTHLRGQSNMNGHFGVEFIYAGYNSGVIFTGKASRPVYLFIKDSQVEIRDASHLSGKSGIETQNLLTEELKKEIDDQNIRVAAIGPAGENMVRNADICHDFYHHAARLGMGTVMGSKKLKAVVVKGTRSPDYAHPDKVLEIMKKWLHAGRLYRIQNRRWGHTQSMSGRYYKTVEGIKNKQKGWDDMCDLFNPVLLEQRYKIWGDACHGCPVACKVPYFMMGPPLGPFAGELRHDNAGGWSANVMIPGYELQGYLCSYVDYLGLDGEDVSGVVAWMMECYEKGLVTKEDLGGIDLTWGNVEAICALLKKIAHREGIGDALADGLKFAPAKIGKGTEKFAITGKGVAITSYEPRGSMKDALELAGTAVGEIHGARGNPDRIMFDSLTGCSFWRSTVQDIYGSIADWAIQGLHATCDWKLSQEDWRLLELRGATMERCYSIREGHYVPERDDVMPERFFQETIYNKYNEPKKLNKEEFLAKRKELYRSYGLKDDGTPSPEFLEQLGLEFAIPVMEETLKS